MIRRAGGWALGILAIMWVINDPTSAAHLVQGVGHLATRAEAAMTTISRHW